MFCCLFVFLVSTSESIKDPRRVASRISKTTDNYHHHWLLYNSQAQHSLTLFLSSFLYLCRNRCRMPGLEEHKRIVGCLAKLYQAELLLRKQFLLCSELGQLDDIIHDLVYRLAASSKAVHFCVFLLYGAVVLFPQGYTACIPSRGAPNTPTRQHQTWGIRAILAARVDLELQFQPLFSRDSFTHILFS